MSRIEVSVKVNRDTQNHITGATIEPLGIRIGPVFSGSGFRNSKGTNVIRDEMHAVNLAQQIAHAINSIGGVVDDPKTIEYAEWMKNL